MLPEDFFVKIEEIIISDDVEEFKNTLEEYELDNEDLDSLLITAVRCENEKMVKLLLNHGANPNGGIIDGNTSPMHMAADNNDIYFLKILIAHGGDINLMTQNNLSVLHISIDSEGVMAEGNVEEMPGEVVRFLLEQGANPDTKDNYGKTPLDDAKTYGHVNAIKLLEKYIE